MLAATLGLAILSGAGQSSGAGSPAKPLESGKFDLGLTYTYKLAKITWTTGPFFGLQGGSVDGVYWMTGQRKLGVAFDLSGEAASDIKPGVNLDQISIVAGPRYTLWRAKSSTHKADVYGQALVGYVHAFNSIFPVGASSISSTANGFALQAGGGVNLPLNRTVGLRLFEADYIYTRLTNGADNYQGDVRLSTGLTVHF
jgi:hypothetical protein